MRRGIGFLDTGAIALKAESGRRQRSCSVYHLLMPCPSDVSEMGLEPGSCEIRVAQLDTAEQISVGIGPWVIEIARVPADLGLELHDRADDSRAIADGIELPVETVPRRKPLFGTSDGIEFGDNIRKGLQFVIMDRSDGAAQSKGLHQNPHLVQVGKFVGGESAHDSAPVGVELDHALGIELSQRGPYRHSAHAEQPGKPVLGKAFTRLKDSPLDCLTDHQNRLVLGGSGISAGALDQSVESGCRPVVRLRSTHGHVPTAIHKRLTEGIVTIGSTMPIHSDVDGDVSTCARMKQHSRHLWQACPLVQSTAEECADNVSHGSPSGVHSDRPVSSCERSEIGSNLELRDRAKGVI